MVKLFLITFLFVLGSLSFGTLAYASPKRVLVSVGDLKENNNLIWKKHTCDSVYQLANQINGGAVDVTCRTFDTSNFLDPDLSRLKSNYSFHLRVLRGKNGDVSMDVTHWSRVHETDFKTLGWNFKDDPTDKQKQQQVMAKALANFFLFSTYQEAFKAGLLVNGASESQQIEYDQKNGVFKDKFTKRTLSINNAYSLFEKESERKRNYLRTGIEIGVVLSAGMGVYYRSLDSNQQDFDYNFTEGLKKKFTGEAVLYDDNSKIANYGHVYAGVLYYQLARSNGFNSLESFLVSFASSAVWEFMEYHELFSINDQILTPLGGYVIGEASFQISCALLQKGSTAAKILAYSINPGLSANHAIDKLTSQDKYSSQPVCKEPRWSEISMYLGLERNQKPYSFDPQSTYVVGMQADVVNIEDFGKAGKSSQLVYDTALVKALLEKSGGDGMGDLRVLVQTVAAAYHKKDLDVDSEGELRGYDIILGLGSGSSWNDRGGKKKSSAEDFYGTVNILGATAHANLFYKGMHFQAELGFYGDFTMVKAWALNDFKEQNGGSLEDQLKVIKKHGYYWGIGTTTLAALSAQKGRWKVGYAFQGSVANDIHDRNRYETGVVTNPANFEDSYTSHQVYVTFKIMKNLSFKLAHEINIREGSANGQESKSGVERRTMGTLVYLF